LGVCQKLFGGALVFPRFRVKNEEKDYSLLGLARELCT